MGYGPHVVARVRLSTSAACVFVGVCLGLASSVTAADRSLPAFVISLDADGRVSVEQLPESEARSRKPQAGLLIWAEGGRDRWQQLPAGEETAADAGSDQLSAASRGTSGTADAGSSLLTTQIDQLLGLASVRGGAQFITPIQGPHLNPQLTFRRRPSSEVEKYPAVDVEIVEGSRTVLSFQWPEGTADLAWADVPKLPSALKAGLPPGEYVIRVAGEGAGVTFSVVDADERDWVLEPVVDLESLIDDPNDPLIIQFRVESLIDEGYLADALDELERLPDDSRTPYLVGSRTELRKQLSRQPDAAKEPSAESGGTDNTGIAVIDRARAQIAASQWDAALTTLTDTDSAEDARTRGLGLLYRAVILTESGQATGGQADEMFGWAIETLQQAATPHPSDLYRALNNFANHLLTRAQDRLYNHAFQMAAGAQNPLVNVMYDWVGAHFYYDEAMTIATELGARPQAAVGINQARLSALLADVIRTMNTPDGSIAGIEELAAAAADQANSDIARHLSAAANLDPLTRAVGRELQAHLAYRSGDREAARQHAADARNNYLAAGSLAGAESIHRLLGMLALRGDSPAEALRQLMISQSLAQFLRDRIPADRIGLTRAGFLSRRAYVNEQIIHLLVEQQRFEEALEFAEAVKARALQDLLRTKKITLAEDEDWLGVESLLADWPPEVAALEYYLGAERGWVFTVDRSGTVTAQVLTDDAGQPIVPRELVADIHQLLEHFNGQAKKMLSKRRFDKTWQEPLHRLFRLLIPAEALDELRQAKTVVLVPHHILHYLPFAALVVEPDAEERGRLEVPMARFLIDEPFALNSAPSLIAWRRLREASDPMTSVNVVGIVDFESAPSLPGVKDDMDNLRKSFGDRIQLVVEGKAATEPAVAQLLERPGLAFIATHGLNIADQPLNSFLMCRRTDETDGLLCAYEIYDGTIGADLIVTSACYSGLADRSPLPGDDLFGLQRAFLQAGAATVVSGVWDIYDKTGPMIMGRFCDRLAAGEPAPQALAAAQRDYLKEQRSEGPGNPWIHPYFWAVYQSSGSDLTRFETAQN